MEYQEIWNKVLISGDQVKYEFSVSGSYNLACMVLGILGGIGIILTSAYVVGVLVATVSVFYFGWLAKKSNAYAFTDKKVVIYRGWISSELVTIDYNKITDIFVEQNIIGRFTNSGNLVIDTAGSNSPEKQKMENIDNPYETKKQLDQICEFNKK